MKFKTLDEANDWMKENVKTICCLEIEGFGECIGIAGKVYSAIAGRLMKPWQKQMMENFFAKP